MRRFASIVDGLRFFLIWLRKPRQLGAVLPSSERLAATMAGRIDPSKPGVVIDLGAGTGRMTAAILRAGIAPENLIVVEREPALCRLIEKRFPDVRVFCADAAELDTVLRQAGIAEVSTIVSSIPFLSIKNVDCRNILDAALAALPDDGEIVQFTYGPGSPIPERIRAELGVEGERVRWVRANLPPAAVWRFRRGPQPDQRRAA